VAVIQIYQNLFGTIRGEPERRRHGQRLPFHGSPGYNLSLLAERGDFGLIADLLISKRPEVVFHSPQGKFDRSELQAFGRLSLLGPAPERRPPFPLHAVTWSSSQTAASRCASPPSTLPSPPCSRPPT
jgi:hypothetical protein